MGDKHLTSANTGQDKYRNRAVFNTAIIPQGRELPTFPIKLRLKQRVERSTRKPKRPRAEYMKPKFSAMPPAKSERWDSKVQSRQPKHET